ncbi:uncharacterized protein LOC123869472 isoform X2 [Maniola jurtina]|uniref:uncharacterized protein LOC123869472 isoform X2 n=1 Tax=Maniola jurtina TaxID=191418 RepID=UPI001E68A8EB|nr:uncharacterized protein LOC123869472 isoform X2 [Maniola jurtina]
MRSRDRLDELRHLAQQAGVYPDSEPPVAPRAPLSKDIDELLREVEPVRMWILDVERNTQLIRRLHADPTYTSNRQLQEQLDALATASHALGLKACGALRQLAARARSGAPSGAASRMARLQFAATRRLCDAALARHERALQALRDQQHRLLHEQIRLTNVAISEEECEHLLESNNIALFVDNLHAETAEARLALREAEARRDELARVERSLHSVRDLFLQLAHLVAAQQEQIDSVEFFALQASEHVESGGHELLQGTVSRRRTRKKKMGLIVCLAAGCLVVLLVLVLS